jgi:hypothetical protein
MAAVHKILTDFYEDSFTLFALHSSLEDYAMVYALNLCLKSNFKRTAKDLELFDQVAFPIFEWKDAKKDRFLTLITNKGTKEQTNLLGDLFENETSFARFQVVPEYRDADYLLKIEHDDCLQENLIQTLMTIPKIVTVYAIEIENIKSRTNLIF